MSYNNLSSTSKLLGNSIWTAIKADKELNKLIKSEDQISYAAPSNSDKTAQLSIYLYDTTELPVMRNQLQATNEPQTLLYLKLHYLITPLTRTPLTDQVLLGKIVQLLGKKPILHGSDLQGSLADSQNEIRITLDMLSMEDKSKLWIMLQAPYKLSASYSVYPIEIKADAIKTVVSIRKRAVAVNLSKKKKSA